MICYIHHGLGLNVDSLCIAFILDLCSGLKLCSCKYIKGFKKLHSLICSQRRNGIYHGRKDRKSTSLCLCLPLRCISVSVEYNTLMLREPTIRNSNLFPVNANGDVLFRSVASFMKSGSVLTPVSRISPVLLCVAVPVLISCSRTS